MTNVAFIFPGQGAQKVGMGLEFYQSSPEARAIFDEADGILKNGLKDVIFNGPPEKLTSTAYCQPAILTMSVAALKAFMAHPKFKDVSVRFTAGHSLGEYTALVAAGALSFADTLRLVERRAAFMEEAAKVSHGKMAAIIGLPKEKIIEICAQTGAEAANFNSSEQTVITGRAGKVVAACEAFKTAGAKSVIPLDVSGAFHSSLMRPAAEKFAEELKKITFNPPLVPVVGNVSARPSANPLEIRENLGKQITSSVQWVDSIRAIAGQGITRFIEIGPGKVLKGLLRRIDPGFIVSSIETPSDIELLFF